MGTTPGGLPYPEPTDPIAAGADAIKALAQALDLALYWDAVNQLTLAAGWSWSPNNGVQRRKDGKWVRFRGVVNRDGGLIAADVATTILTLPVGWRPASWYRTPISTGSSASIRMQVSPSDGTCTVTSSVQINTGGYWQLDNVEFPTTLTP